MRDEKILGSMYMNTTKWSEACVDGDRPHQKNLRRARYSQPYGLYYITKCIKGVTELSLTQRDYIVRVLMDFREKGWLYLQAFVIMPDHLHALFCLGSEKPLSIIIKEICRKAGYAGKKRGEPLCWQQGFYDHKVRAGENVVDIVSYIENNPVRKGMVERAEEWSWSSANPSYREGLDRMFLGHERWSDKCRSAS